MTRCRQRIQIFLSHTLSHSHSLFLLPCSQRSLHLGIAIHFTMRSSSLPHRLSTTNVYKDLSLLLPISAILHQPSAYSRQAIFCIKHVQSQAPNRQTPGFAPTTCSQLTNHVCPVRTPPCFGCGALADIANQRHHHLDCHPLTHH